MKKFMKAFLFLTTLVAGSAILIPIINKNKEEIKSLPKSNEEE